jgi:hypothetical protein
MLCDAGGRPTTSAAPDVRPSETKSSSSSHPQNNRVLPESYEDQVAFLYNQIEELKRLFEYFIEDHHEMSIFRDLKDPIGRLVISPDVVKITLDDFCKAVKCVL